MKNLFFAFAIFLCCPLENSAQKDATFREYEKDFLTYPFSDPNPIPLIEKIYPYFRYDGFTDKPVHKHWKVVELENDYIRVMILPEIGGKIWAAFEKSTGKSFVYYNQSVKFRDVAMRGPWTSGGIEPNYGIIGHTPNCATPVDYVTTKKEDGSVSCVIGVLDLLTRTPWRLEISLPKDKAYLVTKSFWFNATPLEQAYYSWMNTGIKANGNLEFIYPGTHYLGHEGEHSDWPINKQNGKNISFYKSNDFGGPKSYHVFGKYTEFFGAFWHDDNFGMGRYSTHDDKAGKKIWIWGLSPQGMIWEKLLTDVDGQYVEVQSGRLFNQADVGSTSTPFKHGSFFPYASDTWTEYWFPVKNTKGFVKANEFGALNLKKENGLLKIYFFALQPVTEELKVSGRNKEVYSRRIDLKTTETFSDSISFEDDDSPLLVKLGEHTMIYNSNTAESILQRPLDAPKEFDWNSAFGLYTAGKENLDQRFFEKAKDKLEACLKKDPHFLPALTAMSLLMLHNMRYDSALLFSKRGLSIDTYDPAANYYYALANQQLGNITDAKDGFDIAALSMTYRSASYTELSKIYYSERNFSRALDYAEKSCEFNRSNLEAYKTMMVIHRLQGDRRAHEEVAEKLLTIDPLNHFARFENYLANKSAQKKNEFLLHIRNELPHETFLELAAWYLRLGRGDDAFEVLALAPETAETLYWLAYLKRDTPLRDTFLQKAEAASPRLVFPFRHESETILKWAANRDNEWKPKYYLGLLYWHRNNIEEAKKLFQACGNVPDFAPFYAGRANLMTHTQDEQRVSDLERAIQLDKDGWRYHKLLAEHFMKKGNYDKALSVAEGYYSGHRGDYIMGMLYAKALLLNKKYKETDVLLSRLNIIPFEGATEGRELYREAKLMQAVQEMRKKNYKKALQFIEASKLYPENLGVGKPYEADIDARLEDWMSYLVYQKTGKASAANAALQRILHSPFRSPQATALVSAWAREEVNKRDEGTRELDELLQKYPGNKTLMWTKEVFLNHEPPLLSPEEKNATLRILEEVHAL